MCFDIQFRKWTIHKNTLGKHCCPGCLVTQDYLYLFSKERGIERRFTKNDYLPWERVQTNIKLENFMKLYPVPNENNKFYILIGGTATSRITINNAHIEQEQIDTNNEV